MLENEIKIAEQVLAEQEQTNRPLSSVDSASIRLNMLQFVDGMNELP
jgi:hypothetical protein